MNILKEFLSEDNGNLSTMRIIILFVIFVVMFNWTWINIVTGTIVSFSWPDFRVILGPLFAKAYQKGKEE